MYRLRIIIKHGWSYGVNIRIYCHEKHQNNGLRNVRKRDYYKEIRPALDLFLNKIIYYCYKNIKTPDTVRHLTPSLSRACLTYNLTIS